MKEIEECLGANLPILCGGEAKGFVPYERVNRNNGWTNERTRRDGIRTRHDTTQYDIVRIKSGTICPLFALPDRD